MACNFGLLCPIYVLFGTQGPPTGPPGPGGLSLVAVEDCCLSAYSKVPSSARYRVKDMKMDKPPKTATKRIPTGDEAKLTQKVASHELGLVLSIGEFNLCHLGGIHISYVYVFVHIRKCIYVFAGYQENAHDDAPLDPSLGSVRGSWRSGGVGLQKVR